MGKKICIVADFVEIVPFFYNLAQAFKLSSVEIDFLATTVREHELLTKNKVNIFPKDLFRDLCNADTIDGILSETEIENVIRFASLKSKSSKVFLRQRAQRVARVAHSYLVNNNPNAVVVWNGEWLSSKVMVHLAKKKNIPIIFGENGYFPNTLQFDLSGVNLDSSLCKMSIAELASLLNKQCPGLMEDENNLDFQIIEIKRFSFVDRLKTFFLRKIWPGYAKYFPEVYGLESGFRKRQVDVLRTKIPVDNVVLPEHFIFVPLQVHDDTQILFNSKHFKNMEDFIEFSYDQMRKVFGDKFTLVVKEHPEDIGRISYNNVRARHPDIMWLKKYDLNELLEKASLVFVINSSVGLQAIQKYKPVVAFGDSFYAKDDVVYKIDDLKNAHDIIKQAFYNPIYRENIDILLRYLNERFFIDGSWKNYNGKQLIAASNRVLSMIGLE